MAICHGCGGVIGRDCFNPIECEQITRSMAAEYQTQPNYEYQINELMKENENLKSINKELLEALELTTRELSAGFSITEWSTPQIEQESKDLIVRLKNLIAKAKL